ncbi:MAG: CPBP family intramembrane glutamic endopeptidase [Chloroflexota bacterium]
MFHPAHKWSATPLLLTVPEAPGLLLAYVAVGVLEEAEFRGILLGQISARLRAAAGTGIAVVVALLASTAVFALLHAPSFGSFGWTDLRLLPGALQEVAIMGLGLGLCYVLTGNLVFAMVVHTLFNSGEFVLLAPAGAPAAHPFVVAALIVALAWGGLRWLHTRRESELGLIGLLVWLGFFGVALAGLEQLAGWPAQPALPDHLPSWASTQVWLNSPMAGLDTLVRVALDLAWIVWGLTAVSILLQALVDLLDAATRGAAWVRSLRLATSWLVVPPIRRAVDASLSGLLLARVLVQPAAAAEASSVPVAGIVMMAPADAQHPTRVSATDGIGGRFAAEIAAPRTQTRRTLRPKPHSS